MYKRRKFSETGCQHLYQISIDKSIIFCTVADMVLLFTLICTKAKQYNVQITEMCIMFNHFHIQAYIRSRKDMEEFMSSVTWAFAIMFNRRYGLEGKLFHKPYGNAPKVKHKKIKDNLIYIANNPVEKKAVSAAWEYRWNFLRYTSPNPFSEVFDPLEASKEMLYLVKAVKLRAAAGKVIDYDFFDSYRVMSLCEKEKQQLIDFIIYTYNVIDYQPIIERYGSIDNYCHVLNEVEGKEYDEDDDWEPEDYKHYMKMISIAEEEGYNMRYTRYEGVEGLPPSCKRTKNSGSLMPKELAEKLIKRYRNEVRASTLEICKFLRIGKN